MEVCGVAYVVPGGVRMLRTDGRYIIAGLVTPDANFTINGNEILIKWNTLKGIHNFHPRHLVQALDFVTANRSRFPFTGIVDSKFSLEELDDAFAYPRSSGRRRSYRASCISP